MPVAQLMKTLNAPTLRPNAFACIILCFLLSNSISFIPTTFLLRSSAFKSANSIIVLFLDEHPAVLSSSASVPVHCSIN